MFEIDFNLTQRLWVANRAGRAQSADRPTQTANRKRTYVIFDPLSVVGAILVP